MASRSHSSQSYQRIPFTRAAPAGREADYLLEAVQSMHLSGDGPFTRRCHALLAQMLGASHVLLTTSCTHALEMSALLLNLEPGDEVVVPSFTFVSTANAFVMHGGVPRFVDIRPDTLNLDEQALDAAITSRTRAIVAVHYAGVACEMDAILSTARRHGLAVIEDNAHGLFGRYKGQPLGALGDMATLSFHETKNVTCGEGGALILRDEALMERAEILREKGTNRSRFFRGEVEKYMWVDVGSSYLPSELVAAFLCGQLEASDRIQARRRVQWTRYEEALGAWAVQRGIRLPVIPPWCEQPFHLFYMILPSRFERDALLAHLTARQVSAVFHYLPLHLSPMGQRFGGAVGDCPVTEAVSDRLIRLPLTYGLSDEEQMRVIDATLAYAPGPA